MTTRLHVALGSLAGVIVGAAGALWLRPRPPAPACEVPAGRYYKVGDEVFVDRPFVDWMRSKIAPVEREWIVFPFKKFGVFVRFFAAERRLPGQQGHLYEVRMDEGRDNDRQAAAASLYLADLRRVPWHFYLKEQIGRRFLVRTEDGDPENDRQALAFLEALVSVGVIKEGGRWSSWDELMPGAGGEEGDDGEDT